MRHLLFCIMILFCGANAFSLECDGVPEGEPQLEDGYQDTFNSGCGHADPMDAFQNLAGDATGALVFCGKGGWFLDSPGFDSWDTDWFTATIGASGVLEWTLEAEQSTYGFLMGPNNCYEVMALQIMTAGPWAQGYMEILGNPGDLVWLWVGPVEITPPPGFIGNEFTYISTFTGLGEGVVDTDRSTFGRVKSIYR